MVIAFRWKAQLWGRLRGNDPKRGGETAENVVLEVRVGEELRELEILSIAKNDEEKAITVFPPEMAGRATVRSFLPLHHEALGSLTSPAGMVESGSFTGARSSAWLERLLDTQEVAGSSPAAPTRTPEVPNRLPRVYVPSVVREELVRRRDGRSPRRTSTLSNRG